MRRAIGILIISLAATSCGLARLFPVSEHLLSNGMKILVSERRGIPNATLYIFFRVGSRNEKPGITGASHFLEHMMFNGANKYGPKQFDVVMERNGGTNNAYTTRDVTAYSDFFPRAALELVLSMEADRIRSLSFDPKMVESERGVILSERRSSTENDNFGFLYKKLYEAAYQVHPYRWPVLGWASDIESITAADLRDYFQMGYSPSNCVVVLVGDVKDSTVLALARKYLEPIPSHEPPPPVAAREPEQRSERRIEVERPGELPLQLFSYHVPPSDHPDRRALQVMSAVLTSGQSSRLYHRLVRHDHLALSVSSWQRLSLDPGELIFHIQARRDADMRQVERTFLEELERVKSAPLSNRELKTARSKLLTDHARATRTNSGGAEWLGVYEIFFGDFRKLFSIPEELQRVTAADVQRVARLYLRESNRTVATLKVSNPDQPKP
jgi:zinc protease